MFGNSNTSVMLKKLFSSLFSSWPSDIPRLYPDLEPEALASFLTEVEFCRIKEFDCVHILPFADEDSSGEDVAFGVGLSHQLIRNLMLLTDVSIHGPEDTPRILRETTAEVSEKVEHGVWVTGTADRGGNEYVLDFEVWKAGEAIRRNRIVCDDWLDFLKRCTIAIAKSIGSNARPSVEEGWTTGQAKSDALLEAYGAIAIAFEQNQSQQQSAAAIQLLKNEKEFALPGWLIDTQVKGSKRWLMETIRRDPHNAQLYFEAFCSLSYLQVPDPCAVQLCRKAIELSPGHGKVHMCSPHRAPKGVHMLNNSELGYRLLPGNTFAVNNYISNLRKYNAPSEQLMELAKEGIRSGPEDPGNYYQMIELFSSNQEFGLAVKVAEQLLLLFEPELNERAMYCLRQSPHTALEMDAGRFDPREDTKRLIKSLKQKQSRTSS